MKIKLNPYARESAHIYVDAIIDACAKAKVADPRTAIIDTDDFPALLKIPTVEYAIGWMHGCAESHGVLVEVLWDEILALKKRRAAMNKLAKGLTA